MRRFLVAAVAAGACVQLAACGTFSLGSAVGLSPAVQNTVHLDTSKALDLAYDGLDFVAVALVEPAVQGGAIKGANAAKIAGLLRQARAVLDTAFNAHAAGIASNPSAAIASVLQMIAEAKSVLNNAGVATPSGAAPAAWRSPEAVKKDVDRVLTELRSA